MGYNALLSLLLTFGTAFAAEPTCETKEICAINQECSCNAGANMSYNRYFYFIFPQLQKGKLYNCSFTSHPSSFSLVLDISHFPIGSIYTCQDGHCPIFPLTLNIDTHNMVAQESEMEIKYFVPASDIPSVVRVKCDKN